MKIPRKATITVYNIVKKKKNNGDTHESHNHSKLMTVLLKMSEKKHNQSKMHIDEFR